MARIVNIYIILLITAYLAVSGCNLKKAQKHVDTETVKKEMESREVKKVKPGEIMSKAQETGGKIAGKTQATLAKHLQSALQSGGVSEAIKYCNTQALPITDSLSDHYGAQIKRVSLKTRNPKNAPDSTEKMLLEAYHFNADKNQEIQENVQELNDKYILYSKPIVIQGSLCLNCHGTPGKEVNQETLNLLKEKYPNDQATGYKVGDLRGMWSIKLSKKKIVQSL